MTDSKTITYKKTGLDWMPDVPEHWEIRRLKSIVGSSTNGVWGDEPKENDEDIYCIRIADFDEWNYGISENNLTLRNIEKSEQDGRILKKFDLLIEKSGGGDISPVGRVVFYNLNYKAVSSNFIGRLNLITDINREYLYYIFKTLYERRLNVSSIKATTGIQNLDLYSYLQNRIPVPPKAEQAAIVQYIKAQEEKINRFIEKKLRFIELLKGQRQSVIDLAITKGTNPNASLIESGVDWIGKFPQHWQFRKLKFCVSLNSNEIEESEISDEVFKIALENIDNWTGKFIDTGNPQFEGKGVPFKAGDVLFNKLRPYLAKAFIAKSSGFCVGELLVLSPNEVFFTSEFLFQRLMTSDFIDIVNSSTYGAKMPRASWNFIGNLKFPIPPIEEQKQIVAYIKTETATIDTAIAKAEREIELIREYKEAMISEAVIGKNFVSLHFKN